MILLGVTGGVGMGKTTAARLLAARGAAVIDTDDLARQVVEPGQPALQEIRARFGDGFMDEAGRLRRSELARLVFSDTGARHDLERMLHPRIREAWMATAEGWRAEGRPLGAVVIPLLFETDAAASFDATVCVACTADAQSQRLAARGWSPEEVERRLAAQWPIDRKLRAADFVIWAEGGMEVTREQWARVLNRLEQGGPWRSLPLLSP